MLLWGWEKPIRCEVNKLKDTWSISRLIGCGTIAVFTAHSSHLHCDGFEHGCDAISGRNCKIASHPRFKITLYCKWERLTVKRTKYDKKRKADSTVANVNKTYQFPYRGISLAFLSYLVLYFLLIKSFITGFGTLILSRWSMQSYLFFQLWKGLLAWQSETKMFKAHFRLTQ